MNNRDGTRTRINVFDPDHIFDIHFLLECQNIGVLKPFLSLLKRTTISVSGFSGVHATNRRKVVEVIRTLRSTFKDVNLILRDDRKISGHLLSAIMDIIPEDKLPMNSSGTQRSSGIRLIV